jgi:Uma2 family endonuclease
MTTRVEKHLVTFEEFCERIREDQKADLIDGVIHMASPDSLDGNELYFWVARLLADIVEDKELGTVYITRVAFRLAEHQGPEPDVAFVRRDRLHLARYGYFAGPPDLAMEFVSPESVERDYERKRRLYQDAGVPEYWIVDETLSTVTLLRLTDGVYTQAEAEDGRLTSRAVPGFYLRPEWLWASPLPKKAPLLAAMLAGGSSGT